MMFRMTRELVHCHRHRYLLLDKTALFILLTRMGDDDDDDDGGDSKQNKVRQQLFLFIFDLDDECRSCRFPELKCPRGFEIVLPFDPLLKLFISINYSF